MEAVIDTKLRPEQAGFRRGKGSIDQFFALRNIMEECLEWNAPLFQFIAFGSVHCLWRILAVYGIPQNIIELIKIFYIQFEYIIIMANL